MAAFTGRNFRGTDPDRSDDRSLLWKVRQPVVPALKRGYRLVGAATADQRCLPDYLIVGGKRTGSTTLARNLAADDDVLSLFPQREDLKGTYYFDVNYGEGARWYRSHFPTESTRKKSAGALGRPVTVGEASPYYLQHPHAAQRAAQLVPEAKIICVVREPVERAYSHYRERVRQGIEPLATFEAAVAAEPTRLDGEWERMINDPTYVSWNHLNFAYTGQSLYVDAVQRWIDAFSPAQVLVLNSASLFTETTAILSRVRGFLGLSGESAAEPRHFNNNPGLPISDELRYSLNEIFSEDQRSLVPFLTP